MYQLQRDQIGNVTSIKRLEGGASIPLDGGNRDYADYLTWVEAGNTAAEDPAYTIAGFKERKNVEINAARLEANRSTFVHAGHEFACDDLSRSDIDGTTNTVLLTGSFPQPWPGFWKAVDNTLYPISTIDDWKSFYASMGAAGAVNFAKSQQLKATLAAAATIEQVNAIKW